MRNLLIVISLTAFSLFIYFRPIVCSPNTYLFSATHDGSKNYFTAAYYVQYDAGTHFTGLQAPYGNHIVYTDNQPALSLTLHAIHRHLFPVADYTVGILNYGMLLSILLAAVLLYLILHKIGMSARYAILFTLLITLMSPQLYRMHGHFALAYCCFIPLLWYQLLFLDFQSPSFLRSLGLSATLLFFGLLHPYYLLIGAVYLLAYAFVVFLRHYNNYRKYTRYFIYSLFTSVMPIALFQTWLKLTDPVTDRPESPWGLMDYRAVFEGLFLPVKGPLHKAIRPVFETDFMQLFFNLDYQSLESNSYLGLSCLIVMIALLVRMVVLIRKRRGQRILKPVLPHTLQYMTWAGVLVLLFAMAYPFRLGMEFLLDLVPPLKQFRSLGRFAWVFYYTFAVTAAYYIYLLMRVYHIQRKPKYFQLIPLFLISLWGIEALLTLRTVKPRLQLNTFTAAHPLIDTSGLQLSHYQGILSLPFFLGGTEKIEKQADQATKHAALSLAYQSGVPLVCGDMSRVSEKAGQNLRQLLSHPLIYKQVLNDLSNGKPLLVMTHHRRLNKAEKSLLSLCTFKKRSGPFFFYELPLSAFNEQWANARYPYQKTLADLTKTPSSPSIVYRSFDGMPSEQSFAGTGSLTLTTENGCQVFQGVLSESVSKEWEISFWQKIDYTQAGTSFFTFELTNEDGQSLYRHENYISDNTDLDHGWMRFTQKIVLNGKKNKLVISGNTQGLIVDELLIRPVGTDVYTHLHQEDVSVNNYLLAQAKGK